MKRKIDYYFTIFTLASVSSGLFWLIKNDSSINNKNVIAANKQLEEEERDNPLEALKQEFEKTKDPKTNTVPTERLLIAYEQLNRQGKYKTNAAVSFVNWTERGPNNQGGRTRAIWVDLNDASGKTVWVGSVGGGLWENNRYYLNYTCVDCCQRFVRKFGHYLHHPRSLLPFHHVFLYW